MTLTELKENYTKEYNKGLASCGIFWAFDNKQFEESKIPQNAKDSEFLSIGAGGYIHKSNEAKLDYFLQVTAKQLKKDFVAQANRNELILYELINHECFYTCDITDCFKILKGYYEDITEDEIIKVFNKHKKKMKGI